VPALALLASEVQGVPLPPLQLAWQLRVSPALPV